ncbi:hypothetical protein Tharo_0104 [Thauera aromatica K172]|uniref:Uncharacterized protein n=1 Tax=Thauera aromatica K172 TaxID=44139 RepID=A0A2R4BIB6_THAAR|nr:hypothetical protein Tharo_0104 [Thauera aromatica K172]
MEKGRDSTPKRARSLVRARRVSRNNHAETLVYLCIEGSVRGPVHDRRGRIGAHIGARTGRGRDRHRRSARRPGAGNAGTSAAPRSPGRRAGPPEAIRRRPRPL